MRSFYARLFQVGDALLPEVHRIASSAVRQQALRRTAQVVAATHRQIHDIVSREGAGYDNLDSILLHSPQEIETLLDVGH